MKNDLFSSWIEEKNKEEKARKTRIKIEEQLIERFGCFSQTIQQEGFKVSLSAGTTTKVVDSKAISALMAEYGGKLPIRVKYEVDAKRLEALRKINQPLADEILSACETKPRKVAISIKLMEEKDES